MKLICKAFLFCYFSLSCSFLTVQYFDVKFQYIFMKCLWFLTVEHFIAPWFTMFFSTKTDFTVKIIFKQSECAVVTSKLKISNWLHLFHQKSCLFVFLKIKFWISLSLHHETDIVQFNCSVLVLFSLQHYSTERSCNVIVECALPSVTVSFQTLCFGSSLDLHDL